MMPHKLKQMRQRKQEEQEREVVVQRVVPAGNGRSMRDSTKEQTLLSAEKQQRYVRGIAENSKKRKALMDDIDSAAIPMDDIFGTDDKKPWKDHPKYQDFQVKAKQYVDSLPFSQSTQGSSETMHTLARKLNVQLPKQKTPAKPVLTHAIVVEKLRNVDTTAKLNYE